jgi:hypothetical protein
MCKLCPVFASYNLALAVQLGKIAETPQFG